MNQCGWCNLSEDEKRWLLIQNASWSVYLADEQDYIGRCILIANRHCGCLSALTDQEWMDLKQLIEKLESCFQTVLGAELCNWSCLLNDFYKKPNPNPHLHVHVRPRYRAPVTINGVQYADEEFAHHYHPRKGNCLGIKEREALYGLLKKALNE